MRLFIPLALALVTLSTGCDKISEAFKGAPSKTASSKSDDDDDDDKSSEKKHKEKKKKHDKGDAPQASATAASTQAASAAPVVPAGGAASLFTGAPDAAIKFERQKQIPNKPVWIQVVPYWKANTDSPPDEEPWTDLTLGGKEDHATIHLWIQKRDPKGLDDVAIRNNLAWSHVTGAHFDAPVSGKVGQGLTAQIAAGTGQLFNKPAKVWWMVSPLVGDDDLVVFAVVRPDVYPKLEGETVAMLQSLKVAGP